MQHQEAGIVLTSNADTEAPLLSPRNLHASFCLSGDQRTEHLKGLSRCDGIDGEDISAIAQQSGTLTDIQPRERATFLRFNEEESAQSRGICSMYLQFSCGD